MTISKQMQRTAIAWAKKTAIAKPGDVVETTWGGWKKPRRVMIYRVGAHLVMRVRDACHYMDGSGYVPELDMTYYAVRLLADGTPRDKVGSGIALTNLRTDDGKEWKANGHDFNHVGLSWEMAELPANVKVRGDGPAPPARRPSGEAAPRP